MTDPMTIYQRNLAYTLQPKGGYQTPLNTKEQMKFYNWVEKNKVPYDPSPQSDYDMAGFFKALQDGDPRALTAINPNDKQIHYPDYWKTPYHQTFSNESRYATNGAPAWNQQDQLVMPDGSIIYDERNPQ